MCLFPPNTESRRKNDRQLRLKPQTPPAGSAFLLISSSVHSACSPWHFGPTTSLNRPESGEIDLTLALLALWSSATQHQLSYGSKCKDMPSNKALNTLGQESNKSNKKGGRVSGRRGAQAGMVTEEQIATERAALLAERQSQLEGIMDTHDTLVSGSIIHNVF